MTHPSPAEKPSLVERLEANLLTLNFTERQALVKQAAAEISRLAGELAVLDYIRANCKVIAWPGKGAYPIEHNPAASKDSWGDIVHLASLTPTPPAKEQR